MRDWLTHRVAATPEATALVAVDDERRLSYADLDAAVDRTAGRLATLGVGNGDHLGVVLSRGPATVRLCWAAMRLGAVLVPLSPEWDAETLRDRLGRADVTALVCDATTEPRASEASAKADGLLDVPVVSVDPPKRESVAELSAHSPASVASATWVGSDPMTVLFTAGTTGAPRPVLLRLENHLASAVDAAFHFGVSPDDRWLLTHPFHHVCGLALTLRATLYGCALLLPADSDPGSLADTLTTADATGLSASPQTLWRMLEARGTLTDSLRVAVVSGAPASTELLERCRGYSVPAYNAYCVTEAAGEVAAASVTGTVDASETVGRPLLRTDVTVVDEDGDSLPSGEAGEFVVSGPAVADGYYDPSGDGLVADRRRERGIATGDVGSRDEDGRLRVLSRRTDRISVGSASVRTADVAAILREHDAVADAAVVGLLDAEQGEQVGALVVPAAETPDAATLNDHCSTRLSECAVPRRIEVTDSLPLTTSGAVDRDAVRERLSQTVPNTATVTPREWVRGDGLASAVVATERDSPAGETEPDPPAGEATSDPPADEAELDPPADGAEPDSPTDETNLDLPADGAEQE